MKKDKNNEKENIFIPLSTTKENHKAIDIAVIVLLAICGVLGIIVCVAYAIHGGGV